MTDRTTPLTLHMHPLASYCWKVLLALYESDTPFRTVRVDGAPKENKAYAEMWPIAKMPLLQDGARVIPESSIIIEYLQAHHAGSAVLIPVDGDAAREVRLWDRFFDLYVHAPMQKFVPVRLLSKMEVRRDGVLEQVDGAIARQYQRYQVQHRMQHYGIFAGYSLAQHHFFRPVYGIYLYIKIVVDNVSCGGNKHCRYCQAGKVDRVKQ